VIDGAASHHIHTRSPLGANKGGLFLNANKPMRGGSLLLTLSLHKKEFGDDKRVALTPQYHHTRVEGEPINPRVAGQNV
jgi:hypothetical protein